MQSILRPSHAHRWVECHGSAYYESRFVDEPGEAAKWGTEAHKIGAELIDLGRRGVLYTSWEQAKGLPSTDGRSDEQIETAWIYANEVVRLMQGFGVYAEPYMGIERRLPIRTIHEHLCGTPDFWVYGKWNNTLAIVDLKTGHVPVDPFENYQLVCYLAGILGLPALSSVVNQDTSVTFIIVQPRDYQNSEPVRRWKTTPAKVDPLNRRLQSAARSAMSDRPTLRAGKHCRYCRALPACEAAGEAALVATEYANRTWPTELPDDQLGRLIGLLQSAHELLGLRLDALKLDAEHRLRSGRYIKGIKLGQSRGRRVWTDEKTVAKVAEMYGIDIHKRVLITPHQAEKAGLNPDVVKVYSELKPGKTAIELVNAKEGRKAFT